MCGIAGWIDFKEDLREKISVIENMSSTLARRGPDAKGVYLKQNVCLIHRRLIVVDPENGVQPMRFLNDNKDLTLIYNGELYNTEDIRGELALLGHSFKGHSDTEVLLCAFAQWGEECLNKLNGIYAFAVWDEKEHNLFLARDRMGVKPLFYYKYNDGIIFGSEIKTLLANPIVKPYVDKMGLNEIFLLGPGRTVGCGIIKGVSELKPAECANFNKSGMRLKTYWKLKACEHTDSLDKTIEKTRFLISDAIKRQLVSDVPLCCFLSGGLDSSIISKLASDEYKNNNRQLDTYSVDYFDNDKYFTKSVFQPNSDDKFIDLMVKSIGSKHHKVVLENKSLALSLNEALLARDVPGMADIDSSLLLFCREVKKDFTVAISGECADEIFGGYPWYHNKEILFEETFPWSRSLEIRQSIVKNGVLIDGESYVRERYNDTINNTDTLPGDSLNEKRMRQLFMLNLNWFMQTLLDRKDRMSMYNGLEVRVPFCDHRIVEYAYNMPFEIKSLGNREKGIVREAMRGMLPHEILWRKKSPYPKTHNPIYFDIVSQGVKALKTDKESRIADLLNFEVVEDIINNPSGLKSPWYGQLMGAPQILAYILQIDYWMKEYRIEIK